MQKYITDFEKWNEEMAVKYNPDNYHNSRNFLIRWIERARARAILKFLDVKDNDKVLDLGCGAGNMLSQIKRGELYGVDISDTLLSIARQKTYSRPIQLIKGDIEGLPDDILTRKYDKIFCSEVLEHVLHPEKVIEEILKISHPQTIIVFSVPNEKFINCIKAFFLKLQLFDLLFPKISKHMTDEWHLREADKNFLAEFTKGKLVCCEIVGAPFNCFPIHIVARYSVLKK